MAISSSLAHNNTIVLGISPANLYCSQQISFHTIVQSSVWFQISSSTTDKYLFMYISKANQILAESQKFYISDVDPESDLDLICVEDNEDLEDFTLIQSTPEREQGDTTQNLQLKLFIFAKFH